MDQSEEYTPEKPLYYNYGLKNILIKDHGEIKLHEYINLKLCVYKINKSGKYPFLQYLLTSDGNDQLKIPILPLHVISVNYNNNEGLIPYAKVFLSGLLNIEFKNIDETIEFDGFYGFEKHLYLFFDVTECNVDIIETKSYNYLRFALIDEIINRKAICNIKISQEVTDFFLLNESIIYLLDENCESYQIPIVGYVDKPNENKLKFTSIFGESAKDKLALFGPFFYFTNFDNALNKCGENEGVVRFALFTDYIKYIENYQNDDIDKSIIKNELIKNSENNENKKNIQTLRISDHDGLWTEKYDSVYVGALELDDGTFLDDTPIIVLKDYKQQIPLTYHFINKNKSGIL
jgi:hypothetical protein